MQTAQPQRSKVLVRRETRSAYLFLLPSLFFFIGFVVIPMILLAIGIALFVWGRKTQKAVRWIFGLVFGLIALCGAVQFIPFVNELFHGIPILAYGIPAVFSVYFDVFSGFVQALVFTLLTMVYISGACPPPEEQETENGNS